RERGPARSAASLTGEPPPVTRRGAVVWQGFSPGRRDLAARLTLDPQIEATRLPLSVAVVFADAKGERPLLPGGAIPGAGRVTVTVSNTTAQPQDLPTAADAPAVELASVLDHLRQGRPSARRLPSTSAGLPSSVTVTGPAQVASTQAVPYLLQGSLSLHGTTGTVSGPGTTPSRDGGTIRGTLGGSLASNASSTVTFVADVAGAGTLHLDLTAVAALNPAELRPPQPFASWREWAAADPSQQSRRQALDLVVAVAATGARSSSYSPYLGADLLGSGSTEFRWSFATPEKAVAKEVLRPKWGPIGVTGLAAALILGNLALIWRRL
ncbi:MAG: hypothetical protein JWP08_4517, partial [Bryobacterales bacterium]|nr:hypothetical protein [Bryobacterales bacterium]